MVNIKSKFRDNTIIPDNHNTGLFDESLCTNILLAGGTYPNGIVQRQYGDAGNASIDLSTNKAKTGEFVFENYDYSSLLRMGLNNTHLYTGLGITLRFVNCKFSLWQDLTHENPLVNVIMERCSIVYEVSSYSTYNKCFFGTGGVADPLHPETNVTYNDCYIANVSIQAFGAQGTGHVDGMQTRKANNIYFNNCRWEIPRLKYTYSTGLMNVCLYIQPESDCENIVFNNCYINGGGEFSVTAAPVTGKLFNNVVLKNSFIGCSYNTGPYYPNAASPLIAENTIETNKLFISSVRKINNDVIVTVTNDTNTDRQLVLYTNKSVNSYTIPKFLKYSEMVLDVTQFSDLPINTNISVGDVSFVVAFDTDIREENQIRFVNYTENDIPFPVKGFVKELYRDIKIIPDKYNTGCDKSKIVTIADVPGTYGGLYFKQITGKDVIGIDFQYSNQTKSGTFVISNTEFTNGIQKMNGDAVAGTVVVQFVNCQINGWSSVEAESNILFEFYNCNFTGVGMGSNMYCKCCHFGHSYLDGMRALRNVTVEDSYFSDQNWYFAGVYHTDGTHIYGYNGIDVKDILFTNCRFETMAYDVYDETGTIKSVAYVNAALMVQLEYSSGDNIRFEHCYVNGGGYIVYIGVKSPQSGLTLTNVHLNDLHFGQSCQYGIYYGQSKANAASITDCDYDSKLFIGSVFKNTNNETILSVSNDSLSDRWLVIRTNKGIQYKLIPKTYRSKLTMPLDMTWDRFPYDIPVNVGEVDYVVCYDSSMATSNQIRFKNWTGEPVQNIEMNRQVTEKQKSIMRMRRHPQKQVLCQFDLLNAVNQGSLTGTSLYRFGLINSVLDIVVARHYYYEFDYEITISELDLANSLKIDIKASQWISAITLGTIPLTEPGVYKGKIIGNNRANNKTATYNYLFSFNLNYAKASTIKITNLKVVQA